MTAGALSADDRLAIHELVALHGHIVDAGEFERLDELFTADVVYELDDFGLGSLHGIAAIHEASLALGDRNPVGHHVTNVVVTVASDDSVRVRSKGIGVLTDGSVGSVVYNDLVRREPDGWRIARRRVTARRTPITP